MSRAYTEEEASTKLCPLITNINQGVCVGSRCMAWRGKRELRGAVIHMPMELAQWFGSTSPASPGPAAYTAWADEQRSKGHLPDPASGTWFGVAREWVSGDVYVGFCGLAGQPHG